MAIPLYMDVHVPRPVSEGLRRRGASVVTSQEDGTTEWNEDRLLDRATALGRALVTQERTFSRLPIHGSGAASRSQE